MKKIKIGMLMVAMAFFTTAAFGQIRVVSSPNSGYVKVGDTSTAPDEQLDVTGNTKIRGRFLYLGETATTNAVKMEIGEGRSGNGQASFELIGDGLTYPNFGLQFVRWGTGLSQLKHRGNQDLRFTVVEDGHIKFNDQTDGQFVMIDGADGQVKIGFGNPNHKLDVQGTIGHMGIFNTSDKRLKKNIQKYEGGLEEILQINPVLYEYNELTGISESKQLIGVIAQDFEKVAPFAVGTIQVEDTDIDNKVLSSNEYLQIQTDALQYMLVNAVKEQNEKIEDLERKIIELEKMVQTLANNNTSGSSSIGSSTNISLSDEDRAVLLQNEPNPFNGSTIIRYQLPLNTSSASIIVSDINGKTLKQVSLDHTNVSGQVQVNASELSSGMYAYTLVINGQIAATKKMVLSK